MASDNISRSGKSVDFSPRFATSSTVVGSPATNAETVVCSISGIPTDTPVMSGVWLSGDASFTVGTSGTAVRLRIRTGTTAGSGTVVADTGALTGGVSAGNLLSQDVQGTDTTSTGGVSAASGSYCLTLQVTGGAATSTVSQTNLIALVV